MGLEASGIGRFGLNMTSCRSAEKGPIKVECVKPAHEASTSPTSNTLSCDISEDSSCSTCVKKSVRSTLKNIAEIDYAWLTFSYFARLPLLPNGGRGNDISLRDRSQ